MISAQVTPNSKSQNQINDAYNPSINAYNFTYLKLSACAMRINTSKLSDEETQTRRLMF